MVQQILIMMIGPIAFLLIMPDYRCQLMKLVKLPRYFCLSLIHICKGSKPSMLINRANPDTDNSATFRLVPPHSSNFSNRSSI